MRERIRPAASSLFLPSSVRTADGSVLALQLWLDAAKIPASDGATITSWPTRDGLNADGVATGGVTMKRRGINGLPAVQFDGSTGYFTFNDRPDLRFQTRIYVAAVIQTNSVTTNRTLFSKSTYDYILNTGFVSGALNWYNGSAWWSGTAALSATTNYLVEVYFDGSNYSFFVNGAAAGTAADTGPFGSSANQLWIGAQGSSLVNKYDGLIAELMMFGDGRSGTGANLVPLPDVARVRRYLALKYGLFRP